jgi:hypothetical protein
MQRLVTRRKAIVSALGAAAAAVSTFPVVRAFAQGSLQATPSVASAKKLSSPREPVSVPDYELLAHERMSHPAWEYINSGSADEVTLRWNREALIRIRLKPRVMVDVSQVDTRISYSVRRCRTRSCWLRLQATCWRTRREKWRPHAVRGPLTR